MSRDRMRWLPAVLLSLGAILVFTGSTIQHPMQLRAPLADVVPTEMLGATATDIEISEAEQRVAGMDSYVLREYTGGDTPPFSVYAGFYEQQYRGHTIHSPKNCLPGGGWEPLSSGRLTVPLPGGDVEVNRYVIANGGRRALVLYWYQGRGRVAASEYAVKWDLLRDQALRGRSDEALVRIIVPMLEEGGAEAEQSATEIAQTVIPAVARALP